MSEPAPAVALNEVAKTYRQASAGLEVLKSISLSVMPGEIVAIVGPSGAGKSTLLHIAGLLDRPTAGSVFFGGEDCTTMGDDRRTATRRPSGNTTSSVPFSGTSSTNATNVSRVRIFGGATEAGDKSTPQIGVYVLAFEVLSILLLVAAIGAVILTKKNV